MKKRLLIGLSGIACVVGLLWFFAPKASAGTYDNAYHFYQCFGNRIVFVSTTETDGNIYYATRAKRTSSNILFSNIGWKAKLTDTKGKVLQEVYYKMDGNYLRTTDIRTASDGYEYALYSVSLKDFKSRLDSAILTALESGKCKVVFDACIIVKKSGIPGGGMTDQGVSWGKVYTTYDGIVGAEEWSDITKNSLSSYYGKEVEGLFYQVKLQKDSGIAYVIGAGTYCYGTSVSIYAIPRPEYAFSHWNGSGTSTEEKYSIIVTKNLTYKANSVLKNLEITYYRNWDMHDKVTEQQTCTYNQTVQNLPHIGWKKTGYYQTGWKYDRASLGADLSPTETISPDWIKAHLPKVNLYSNWSPNRYTIVFDSNGVQHQPQMQNRDVNYESIFTLPECGYTSEKGNFLGWSLNAGDSTPKFLASREVSIAEIARELGIENSDGAIITFYAIWDNIPAIDAANIYVSLHNAQAGKVTEEYIASYASASDKEDGSLSYGVYEDHTFVLKDYEKDVYLNAKEEGYVKETFVVIDSSGNRVERTIKVYLIDTKIYTEAEIDGTLRFISPDYFSQEDGSLLPEDQGGLKEESVWRKDDVFLGLLKEILAKIE